MSVVVGNKACNAKCPFCISKITPEQGKLVPEKDVNWRNFDIACRLAQRAGVTTVLLTGKGEPTLHSSLIYTYLNHLNRYKFPFVELQTNGIALKPREMKEWYDMGLTTICLSVVHWSPIQNHKIYQPNVQKGYMNVAATVKNIHKAGLMTRLSCMLLKGYVDSVNEVKNLIAFCKDYGIKQLTIRPIDAPEKADTEQSKWVADHTLDSETVKEIKAFLSQEGTPILELAHGGVIYDVGGQNVCWATCITTNKSTEDMRQIIFFPDGTISYDWKYKGAVLLG
jgi:molybdenum cofactor biosynthesis enzyme MoaA